MTLNDLLLATTRRSRQRAAMVYFGQSISYSQFLEEVERAACGLQSIGVRRGDRVALLLQNCPQFAIGYFAALRCGAIVTSTSPIYTSREVSHQWKDAGVRVAIVDEVLRIVVEGARSSCPGLERIVWAQSTAYKRPSARRLKEYGRTSPKEISQATQDLDWGKSAELRKATFPCNRPTWRCCLLAIHGRHNGGIQRGDAHACEPGHQCGTNLWLVDGRQSPTRDHDCRASSFPYLRDHLRDDLRYFLRRDGHHLATVRAERSAQSRPQISSDSLSRCSNHVCGLQRRRKYCRLPEK